ncbi:MAG: FGGY family carbohydrate kinase [Eubacteriales bacterium]|nr:FGGY family carbohydrate kinase [Eubacteriales bacterium]
MDKKYILTCDAGTTGCKATLIDEAGEACASTIGAYDTLYPQPNWAEQDMEKIWPAVVGCIRELLGRVPARSIAAVGLTGTMNGCIPVDAQGSALANNIIHSDSRAWPQLEQIRAAISEEDFYRLTGCRLDHHYMLPKILWLRDERPEVFARAEKFLNTKDYIHGKLTGCFDSTDASDASLTIAIDVNRGCWAEGLLRELGLDAGRMAQIRPGHDVSDCVSAQAAALTGLLEGTPVAVGGGDGSCTARGAGLSKPGDAYCYIGSSAWVSQMTDKPLLDEQARVFNYLDMDGQSYLTCGTVQCGASAYNWALENLLGEKDFGTVEAMARQIAPGSEGVLFLPTLMGERTPYWDPNTRGSLVGFSLYHDRRHIARAIYEGVAFALTTCAQVMRECGRPVQSLMITGGGAKSGLWPQMLASLCGVETRVHAAAGEATSLGAAIAAGVGVGMFAGYADAAGKVRARASYQPDERQAQAYAGVYPVYAQLYGRLKPIFDAIADTGRFS